MAKRSYEWTGMLCCCCCVDGVSLDCCVQFISLWNNHYNSIYGQLTTVQFDGIIFCSFLALSLATFRSFVRSFHCFFFPLSFHSFVLAALFICSLSFLSSFFPQYYYVSSHPLEEYEFNKIEEKKKQKNTATTTTASTFTNAYLFSSFFALFRVGARTNSSVLRKISIETVKRVTCWFKDKLYRVPHAYLFLSSSTNKL